MRVKLGLLKQLIREEIDMSDVTGAQMSGMPDKKNLVALSRMKNPDQLAKLATDPEASVRLAPASNIHTPPEVLEMMVDDRNPLVRAAVVKNPNTPIETLEAMLYDEHPGVSKLAAKYLKDRGYLMSK